VDKITWPKVKNYTHAVRSGFKFKDRGGPDVGLGLDRRATRTYIQYLLDGPRLDRMRVATPVGWA
jgi:hypothetical protein